MLNEIAANIIFIINEAMELYVGINFSLCGLKYISVNCVLLDFDKDLAHMGSKLLFKPLLPFIDTTHKYIT